MCALLTTRHPPLSSTYRADVSCSSTRLAARHALTATGIPRRATSRSALRAGRADRSTIARRSAYILGRAYSAIPDICVLRPRSRTVAGPPLLGAGAGGGCVCAGGRRLTITMLALFGYYGRQHHRL